MCQTSLQQMGAAMVEKEHRQQEALTQMAAKDKQIRE